MLKVYHCINILVTFILLKLNASNVSIIYIYGNLINNDYFYHCGTVYCRQQNSTQSCLGANCPKKLLLWQIIITSHKTYR